MYDLLMWAQQHPIRALAAAVTTAVVAFIVKLVPRTLKRVLCFELILTDEAKYASPHNDIRDWIRKLPIVKKTSAITVGYSEDEPVELGYGSHFFWDRGYGPVLISRKFEEKDSGGVAVPSSSISILSVRKYRHRIEQILKEAKDTRSAQKLLGVYTRTSASTSWESSFHTKRPIDSVILPEKQKAELINTADWFFRNQKWFQVRAVPYRFGILLYGPPGTGKSSIVKAIASLLGKRLYYLNPSNFSNDEAFKKALDEVRQDSIVLIEDVDAIATTANRTTEDNEQKTAEAKATTASRISLSGILNSLDGVTAAEGRLLFLTTNHPDKLDPALIRPGRIDKKFLIGPMEPQQVFELASRFFPEEVRYPLDVLERAEKGEIRPACEWQAEFLDRARKKQEEEVSDG